MEKLRNLRKLVLVAIAALGIGLAVSAPSEARGMDGRGFGGVHQGSVGMNHGFDGRHGVDGHHEFGHGHDRFRHGVPVYPHYYYGYYPYGYYRYQAPAYWYWCASYGAYYPRVTSCPEAWQPVPAS